MLFAVKIASNSSRWVQFCKPTFLEEGPPDAKGRKKTVLDVSIFSTASIEIRPPTIIPDLSGQYPSSLTAKFPLSMRDLGPQSRLLDVYSRKDSSGKPRQS